MRPELDPGRGCPIETLSKGLTERKAPPTAAA